MLSRQILLKTIHDIKGITNTEVSIWDMDGNYVLGTGVIEAEHKEIVESYFYAEGEALGETLEIDGYYLAMVCEGEDPIYLLMLEGLSSNEAEIISSLCVNQLENLMDAYNEKMNKNSFLQNLMRGNISEEEIVMKAERVHLKNQVKRIAFLIEVKTEELEIVTQTLKGLYTIGLTDFVVEMDKKHIVLIKELKNTETEKGVYNMARTIVDTLNVETMLYVRVGYGALAEDLSVLEKTYGEAKMALEVGKSFYAERTVVSYKELGIGRLIHQLPMNLCSEFLQEVLGGNGLSQFDEETMLAAYYFFENNLNISETARKLYIHRNTLVNRLEKIQKLTGLDIRVFEEAMTFKIAIMVSNHMNYHGNQGHSNTLLW